jgi:hypothetical protein
MNWKTIKISEKLYITLNNIQHDYFKTNKKKISINQIIEEALFKNGN